MLIDPGGIKQYHPTAGMPPMLLVSALKQTYMFYHLLWYKRVCPD